MSLALRSLALGVAIGCAQPGSDTDGVWDTDPVGHDCAPSFQASVRPTLEDGMAAAEEALPVRLSEYGLYEGALGGELHPAIREFTPRFGLWSDGSDKTRWVYVPECAVIDASDPNDWDFPVGTRFVKEFRLGGVRLETRVIERINDGEFAYASYLWNEDETEATRVGPQGVRAVKDTGHDIPSKQACLRCHGTHGEGGGRPSRALGFGAVQLDHADTALGLAELIERERVSPAPVVQPLPGDAVAQHALGTLHANCGHCHNDSEDGVPQVDLDLWLAVDVSSVQQTGAWRSAVGIDTTLFSDQHVDARIVPGDPDSSAILYRMRARGNNAQMPPVGTHLVDEQGVEAVRAWIERL